MAEQRRPGYRYADRDAGMALRNPGRTISDADRIAFAGSTGDYSRLRTSDLYAKSSQFGRRVAHGTLGLGAATRPHGIARVQGRARSGAASSENVTASDRVPGGSES